MTPERTKRACSAYFAMVVRRAVLLAFVIGAVRCLDQVGLARDGRGAYQLVVDLEV